MRISASKIIAFFFGCKYYFYLHYILKLPIDQNKWLIMGSISHDIISGFYKCIDLVEVKCNIYNYKKIIRDKIIPMLPLKNKYIKEIKSILNGFIWWESQRLVKYNLSYKGDLCDFLPIMNETKVETENFVGILDIVFKYGSNVHIKDWKISNTKEKKDEYELQLRFYQFLYERIFKKKVKSLSNIMIKTRTELKFKRFEDNNKFINAVLYDFKKGIKERGEDDDNWEMDGKFCAWCPYIEFCHGD